MTPSETLRHEHEAVSVVLGAAERGAEEIGEGVHERCRRLPHELREP
jgi:hypothetical protein